MAKYSERCIVVWRNASIRVRITILPYKARSDCLAMDRLLHHEGGTSGESWTSFKLANWAFCIVPEATDACTYGTVRTRR